MSTAHDFCTDVESTHRSASLNPVSLLIPATRFGFFVLIAILAGAALAFAT